MPNLLANEASLYLQQHADNPVDWQPWGQAAFDLAQELDRPVFISIGYSSCHWCHVMAHESFADPEVADLLNQNFISIKIDREEYPDIDAQYMTAVLLIQGHGGWPMSVFTLPDGRAFFGGTYFPKTSRGGHPGFMDLLQRVAALWQQEREKLVQDAQQISNGVQARSRLAKPVALTEDGIHSALTNSLRHVDPKMGGHLGAPKFPPHTDLRLWQMLVALPGLQNDAKTQLETVTRTTMDHLCWSGLRDQVGGAFHRYCVDDRWHVPHFEQMLYDNAQLLAALARQQLLTQNQDDRFVMSQLVLELQERWLIDDQWFAAAWDADDALGEGGYYTWTPKELEDALLDDAAWAIDYFQIQANGPVDGRSPLYPVGPPSNLPNQDPEEVLKKLRHILLVLGKTRAKRPTPEQDHKGLTTENGIMLSALALALRILGARNLEPFATTAAYWCAIAETGELPAVCYPDRRLGQANLLDYAALGKGLLDWGLATDDPRFVGASFVLAKAATDMFADTQSPTGWQVGRVPGPLGLPAGTLDGQRPSAFALTVDWLTDIWLVSGQEFWREHLHGLRHYLSGDLAQRPEQTRDLWRAVHRFDQLPTTVFIHGSANQAWFERLSGRSHAEIIWIQPTVFSWLQEQGFAAVEEKIKEGAYVCSGASCQPLAERLSILEEQLQRLIR